MDLRQAYQPVVFAAPNRSVLVADVQANGTEDATLHRVNYPDATRIADISTHPLVVVSVGHASRADCRVGSATLDHRCEPGNVTLIPPDTSWEATLGSGAELVFVSVPAMRLAVAAGQAGCAAAIAPRLRGRDEALLSIVREMSTGASLMPASAWHGLVDELADRLVTQHGTRPVPSDRGMLAPADVARLNAYIGERLAERLPIDALADVVGRSRSHFPRLFRRTLGTSPHQYVLRLRLRQARRLVESGCSLAEAAAAVGFSQQSHLTAWMRRIYGTTPGALPRRRRSAET